MIKLLNDACEECDEEGPVVVFGASTSSRDLTGVCSNCLNKAVEMFNEYPINLPAWAVQRIVSGHVKQIRIPVLKSNSVVIGHKNLVFEDFDLDKATVDILHLECQCGSVPGRLRSEWAFVDRLWVLEAFKTERVTCVDDDELEHECNEHCDQTYVLYRATPRIGYRPIPDRAPITYLDESSPLTDRFTEGFRPGVEMRREWSRINLKVQVKRVERIQDISYEESMRCIFTDGSPTPANLDMGPPTGKDWFHTAWDQVHARQHRWEANPWTWVADVSPEVCGGAPVSPEAMAEMSDRAARIARDWPVRYVPRIIVATKPGE